MTPEEIAAANAAAAASSLLAFTKQSANEALIRYLNGLTTNHLALYPQAEVQSWPYQKAEADAVEAAGAGATLTMAPLLTGVCEIQFGAADDAVRLAQVKAKAAIVAANATAWTAISQFVNGLRARTQDMIEASADPAEVNTTLNNAMAEVEVFRAALSAG